MVRLLFMISAWLDTLEQDEIVFFDTSLSSTGELEHINGMIQISEHSFEEIIDLQEFFTGTIRVIADSQEVNKDFQMLDLGRVENRKTRYWIAYFRPDPTLGKTLVASYYLLGKDDQAVVQVDFMTFGEQFDPKEVCLYSQIIKSVKMVE